MATQENIEYLVLHYLAADIALQIAADPVTISAKLLEEGFIPQAQHDSKMQDKESKAKELVERVKGKVRLKPERFDTFIKILSEFPWLNEIVEAMNKKRDELHSDKDGNSIKQRSISCVHVTDKLSRHQKLEKIVKKQIEWDSANNRELVNQELLNLFQKFIIQLPESELKKFEPMLQNQQRESEQVEALRNRIAQQDKEIKQLREKQKKEEDTQEEPPQQSEEEDHTNLMASLQQQSETLRQQVEEQAKEIEKLKEIEKPKEKKKDCVIS